MFLHASFRSPHMGFTCWYPVAVRWVHACPQKPPPCFWCLPVSTPIYPWPLSPLHNLLLPPPGPIMMSLRPGSELDSQTLPPEGPLSNSMVQVSPQPLEPMTRPAEDGDQASFPLLEEKVSKWTTERQLAEKSCLTNGFDVFECPPPKTENEVGGGRGLQDGRGWWAARNDRREPAAWPGLGLSRLSEFSHHLGSE